MNDAGVAAHVPDELITGGAIAGLLRFQNDDLVDARNQLGQMAAAMAGSVNAQQALGLDLAPAGGAGRADLRVGGRGCCPRPTTQRGRRAGGSYVNGSGDRVPA